MCRAFGPFYSFAGSPLADPAQEIERSGNAPFGITEGMPFRKPLNLSLIPTVLTGQIIRGAGGRFALRWLAAAEGASHCVGSRLWREVRAALDRGGGSSFALRRLAAAEGASDCVGSACAGSGGGVGYFGGALAFGIEDDESSWAVAAGGCRET
ncbi:hypothetical protein BH10ACI4_BH10ACI4_24920 [soil metagenome]